ncbi:hypothetical protein [Mycobacterium sp. ACS1612]|uniref:hypothetical protein n=1 Tax=Mycobacterium sp. ACS1612 TaxID=1834117 RepID=UPI0009EE5891|nr:hypothetical protein [Mycobacterium sp. ACS1612]
MRSVKATAWRHGKSGRPMLPVLLVCAGIIVALAAANLLAKAGAEPAVIQTDDRGFVDKAARCDAPKSALALGRTEQSLVAICVDGSGHYEYRGMRVKDDYALKVPGAVMLAGKYVARNANFTYIFSPKELMILQGWGWVIRKEPMVAFVEPRLPVGG